MIIDKDYISTNAKIKSDLLWRIFRSLAFCLDADRAHELAILCLKKWSQFIKKDLAAGHIAKDEAFFSGHMGLSLRNPIGLAAGFDVNAECLPALQALGFGFIEVGGVTEHAQAGNDKPRIFRLAQDQALINRVNFANKGAAILRKNLNLLREQGKIHVPIGVNLGKAKSSKPHDIPLDYLKIFKQIHSVADYVTINISWPTTKDLLRYQSAGALNILLDPICNFNESLPKKIPLLLKLGPDLQNEEAIACAELAIDYGLLGLIISHTTSKRVGLSSSSKNFGPGGLSGKPLFEKSTQLLRCIAKDYGGKITLIGAGGVMNGANALAKLHAGANLLQVYTGFIYGGPNFVCDLLYYLRNQFFRMKESNQSVLLRQSAFLFD